MFSMMQAAAAALANERNWLGSAMLHHFVHPLAEDHRTLVRILSSGSAAVQDLYAFYADGGRARVSFEILSKLHQPDALRDCGFILELETEGHVIAVDDDPQILEQDTLASRADSAVFHLVRQRSLAAVQFTDSVVGALAAICRGSPAAQTRALSFLQKKYSAYAKSLSKEHPLIRKWSARSDCGRPVETRILQSLQEVSFSEVPAAVKQEAEHIYSGEVSTLIVENAFKELRAKETGSSNLTISRLARHLHLLQGSLPQRFNRGSSVPQSSAAGPPPTKVGARTYCTRCRDSPPPSVSLGDIAKRPTWPTFDRASLFGLYSEAAFLTRLDEDDAWSKAGLHWRNRFLIVGEVYKEVCTGRIFRVLGTSSGASLVWELQPYLASQAHDKILAEAGQGRVNKKDVSTCGGAQVPDCWTYGPDPPDWFSFFEWDSVESLPCVAISPLGIFARGLSAQLSRGVALLQNQPARSLLQHAARCAFKGLKDADLRSLAREMDLQVLGLAS